MSEPDQSQHIEHSPVKDGSDGCHSNLSPSSPNGQPFRVPGRRTRTISESERILAGPSFSGKVVSFCRQKGHGFVQPSDGTEPLFMHISDIEGDIVPKEGDEVTFKRCLMPPKNEKYAAVHVHIAHQAPVAHEKWDKDAIERPICSASELE